MKSIAKFYIVDKIKQIRKNDKDNWNIAYGMISLARQLDLITDSERKSYLIASDHAYFLGKDKR